MRSRAIYGLTLLATVMSFGHHVDHVIRGNAVGWPLTPQINAFSASLVIYPIIATALLLYRTGRIGPGTWALVSGGGAAFVGTVHFGPSAVEPPSDIVTAYEPAILGWLAFAWLVAFVTILILTSLYEARIWYSLREAHGAGVALERTGTAR